VRVKHENPPLLKEAWPELFEEIRGDLLGHINDPRLAFDHSLHLRLLQQLEGLRMVERCRCGTNLCASFYTVPVPRERDGWLARENGGSTVPLKMGFLHMHLLFGCIVEVEDLRPSHKLMADAIFEMGRLGHRPARPR
jgi:hypothetical protein